MSLDYAFFVYREDATAEQYREWYLKACPEEPLDCPANRELIDGFVRELTAEYPQLSDYAEEDLHKCPWTDDFSVTDRYVILHMSVRAPRAANDLLCALSHKHNLVLYDPQSDAAFRPDGSEIGRPWWKFW